jgi:hypothetical protein
MEKSLAAETVLTSGRAGRNRPTLLPSTRTTEFLLLSSDFEGLVMGLVFSYSRPHTSFWPVFTAVALGGTFWRIDELGFFGGLVLVLSRHRRFFCLGLLFPFFEKYL